ncbi:MAG: uncharacterized protein KVP18_002802 [Porospora cf. gigantea A]|uniref:uncharacterized protein n=1 Tax=Porospora cf. gigantea A TaxID=2853593 RepID=UPI00355A2D1C|nr:MAG: hypothetical protein KVP18_002802 [Porospora cf. gigantea A]
MRLTYKKTPANYRLQTLFAAPSTIAGSSASLVDFEGNDHIVSDLHIGRRGGTTSMEAAFAYYNKVRGDDDYDEYDSDSETD